MTQRFDDRLIERAADRLSQIPGLGTDLTRRESMRLMVRGLVAGVMVQSVAGLAGAATASASAVQEGPEHGGRVGPHEEVLVCYFAGQGTFSDDLRFITLNMTMYNLDGKPIGTQHGVHESQNPDLFTIPPTPPPPFDAPPVPHEPTLEWTKGIWTFADGSGVYAAGPARSHIVPFRDGSVMFTVTTGQTITGGLGRYANAYGVKQATGSAFVPAWLIQQGLFPSPGLQFEARTIEVFRLVVPDAK